MSLKAKSIRESFLKYFWTNFVRNEFDWGCFFVHMWNPYRTGGWEEGKDEENQIGARFGACMWIYTNAATSVRSRHGSAISKSHSIKEAAWEVLYGTHAWIQDCSTELPESNMMWIQDDIEVPCIMQWGLLSYSALRHPDNVLIKVGVFQACFDKTIKRAIDSSFACPFGERHAFMEAHHTMTVRYMLGCA